jgi:cell division protease FtsH
VDTEVKRVIDQAYNRAKSVLTEHLDLLHKVAKALLERETLTRDDIEVLRRGEQLPPRTPTAPPTASAPLTSPVSEPRRIPPIIGGPEPSPA